MHVFLDRCNDIGPLSRAHLQSPRVIIHRMDWRRFNPDPIFDGFIDNMDGGRLDARLFAIYRRLHPNAFEIHPQHGLKCTSQRVALPVWGRVKQPYRPVFYGDLFRCMLCVGEPDDLLYADVDICFLKDFTPLFASGDFLYRWERQSYANNALIYSSANGVLKQAVRDLVKHHDTVWPWYIFRLDEPRLAGVNILPCEPFDPLWTNDSGLTFEDFFNATDVLSALEGAYCHHWHNHWHAVPHPDSTYMQLLRGFQRTLGVTKR